MSQPSTPSASEKNRAYYSDLTQGKDDYFRKMAAPRFRVRTLLCAIAESLPAVTATAGGEPVSLVDLGCGNGQLLAEIGRRFPTMKLYGADIAEPQLAVNRGQMPGCEFFAVDLGQKDAVPAALAGRFHLVTASEVIEHIDEPAHFLRNAYALCRPRGRLFLSTQSGPVRETERRVGHHRHFKSAEMRELLSENGFTALRVWNSGFPFHDLSKWYANRDPDAMMREFAGQRYGIKQDLLCLLLRAAFRLNSQSRGAQLFAVAERAS